MNSKKNSTDAGLPLNTSSQMGGTLHNFNGRTKNTLSRSENQYIFLILNVRQYHVF